MRPVTLIESVHGAPFSVARASCTVKERGPSDPLRRWMLEVSSNSVRRGGPSSAPCSDSDQPEEGFVARGEARGAVFRARAWEGVNDGVVSIYFCRDAGATRGKGLE